MVLTTGWVAKFYSSTRTEKQVIDFSILKNIQNKGTLACARTAFFSA